MFVSIYYKPSLFNTHATILIVHIFMNVNKLCLNQEGRGGRGVGWGGGGGGTVKAGGRAVTKG